MKTEHRTGHPGIDAGDAGARANAPVYTLIADVLRKAIRRRSIPPGAVLLEGPVAELLHATRTPVRQAFQVLEDEKLLSRFEGRGFVAGRGGCEPLRVALTAAMLGIEGAADPVRKTLGWEAIYDGVERDVVHVAVFGSQRLNELELARHCGVGRLVARDVLLRLERLGLIEKDERLRWVIRPLDGTRINHLYELRWLLEPVAIRAATEALPAEGVTAKLGALRQAISAYPKVAPAMLDRLETDLHVETLSYCPNQALLQSLERTRCVLTLSKHVLGTTAPMPKGDPFMAEHLAILEAVDRRDATQAEGQLRAHLEASCLKVMQRAEAVRASSEPPYVPYLAGR